MEINIIPAEPERLRLSTQPVKAKAHGAVVMGDSVKRSEALKDSHIVPCVDNLEQVFAKFLEMEVGDGAASSDTIRSYLSQSKQYFAWCKDNLIPILEADKDDVKLYRQFLINQDYTVGTIANKLSVVNSLYKAALHRRLITINPAVGVKAPSERVDPASNISFLELDELELLLGEIESQLNQAKTNKQRLPILRDRALVGIMSLEGCRTVELHNLKLEQILHQGQRTGLKVFAKRASRVVPLTDTLTEQLEEYLLMRRTVLRRKIKPEDYVFVSLSNNSKNQQLSRRGIRAIVDRYLIATGLKYKKGRTKLKVTVAIFA